MKGCLDAERLAEEWQFLGRCVDIRGTEGEGYLGTHRPHPLPL